MLADFIEFLQENKLMLFLFYAFIFIVSRLDVHIGLVLATMLVYAHAVDLWQNSELYVEFEYGVGGGAGESSGSAAGAEPSFDTS